MGDKIFNTRNIQRANGLKKGCVIIQTCDAYRQYWDSFFWSFKKYWDSEINWPIFFCNEEIPINISEPNCKQLKTGKFSHSVRMAKILDELVEYDYVFYMLEDFWLTEKMPKEMFIGLFEIFKTNNWDSLRVAPHMPEYYKLESTNIFLKNQRILKFSKDSDWLFSQQAAFWKRDFLRSCIVEPKISEKEVSSSITGEVAMDIALKSKYPNASIYLYHYHWYPVSGTVWRGKITQMGEQIDFLRKVDDLLKRDFQYQT